MKDDGTDIPPNPKAIFVAYFECYKSNFKHEFAQIPPKFEFVTYVRTERMDSETIIPDLKKPWLQKTLYLARSGGFL